MTHLQSSCLLPDQKPRSIPTPLSDFISGHTKLNFVFISGSEADKIKALLSQVVPLSSAADRHGSCMADKLGSLQQDQVQPFLARCFPLPSIGMSSYRYDKAVGHTLDILGT
jgi:hypothetical protein